MVITTRFMRIFGVFLTFLLASTGSDTLALPIVGGPDSYVSLVERINAIERAIATHNGRKPVITPKQASLPTSEEIRTHYDQLQKLYTDYRALLADTIGFVKQDTQEIEAGTQPASYKLIFFAQPGANLSIDSLRNRLEQIDRIIHQDIVSIQKTDAQYQLEQEIQRRERSARYARENEERQRQQAAARAKALDDHSVTIETINEELATITKLPSASPQDRAKIERKYTEIVTVLQTLSQRISNYQSTTKDATLPDSLPKITFQGRNYLPNPTSIPQVISQIQAEVARLKTSAAAGADAAAWRTAIEDYNALIGVTENGNGGINQLFLNNSAFKIAKDLTQVPPVDLEKKKGIQAAIVRQLQTILQKIPGAISRYPELSSNINELCYSYTITGQTPSGDPLGTCTKQWPTTVENINALIKAFRSSIAQLNAEIERRTSESGRAAEEPAARSGGASQTEEELQAQAQAMLMQYGTTLFFADQKTVNELTKAYRKTAVLQWHPDKWSDKPEILKEAAAKIFRNIDAEFKITKEILEAPDTNTVATRTITSESNSMLLILQIRAILAHIPWKEHIVQWWIDSTDKKPMLIAYLNGFNTIMRNTTYKTPLTLDSLIMSNRERPWLIDVLEQLFAEAIRRKVQEAAEYLSTQLQEFNAQYNQAIALISTNDIDALSLFLRRTSTTTLFASLIGRLASFTEQTKQYQIAAYLQGYQIIEDAQPKATNQINTLITQYADQPWISAIINRLLIDARDRGIYTIIQFLATYEAATRQVKQFIDYDDTPSILRFIRATDRPWLNALLKQSRAQATATKKQSVAQYLTEYLDQYDQLKAEASENFCYNNIACLRPLIVKANGKLPYIQLLREWLALADEYKNYAIANMIRPLLEEALRRSAA